MSKDKALYLQKYGSVQSGVSPHPKGDLLKVKDVLEVLLYIDDNDYKLRERLTELIENLQQ